MKNLLTIGIDLHGTLIDEQWEIKSYLQQSLINAIIRIQAFANFYICSGNDRSFLEKYIPHKILDLFTGYVLETGCVISDKKRDITIIPKEKKWLIKKLESELVKMAFPQIQYYGNRSCTISLFTKTEYGGTDPVDFFDAIKETVEKLGYGSEMLVTHSNVAVDIIPKGYNKFIGLQHVAGKSMIVGIADSFNDLHLVRDANLAFIPANASQRLIQTLSKIKKRVSSISSSPKLQPRVVYQCSHSTTEGVIESLEFLYQNKEILFSTPKAIFPE